MQIKGIVKSSGCAGDDTLGVGGDGACWCRSPVDEDPEVTRSCNVIIGSWRVMLASGTAGGRGWGIMDAIPSPCLLLVRSLH